MSLGVLFLIFVILLVVLYLISLSFQKNLYLFFYLLTRKKGLTVTLVSIILLPGTVIHEVSHMLVAEILQVPTGEFSFVPEVKTAEKEIKMGSLKIGDADPIRRTLVGVAPLLVGLAILTAIFYTQVLPVVQNAENFLNQPASFYLLLGLACYLLFIISNTMFSSKKDLETIFFPIILFVLIQTALWIGGIRLKLSLKPETYQFFTNLLKSINYSLGATILIDAVFLLVAKLALASSEKILNRKIISKK